MTTRSKRSAKSTVIEALIGQDGDLLKRLMHEALQQVLEAEMTEPLGARPGERTAGRLGYRAGYYSRGTAMLDRHPNLLAQGRDTCHMPGARDQKSWDAGLGGTKRDGCGTNPCGCCGSCVAPPRARPPPRRIARFRSLRHKLAAWLDGTPQTGASVTDGPRRGSPASPFPWSGCGPHRVGQSSCRVARMRPRVGIPLIPEDPGRSRDQNF